jgi:hypothetical protein
VLPERYPDDIRAARWRPFWENLFVLMDRAHLVGPPLPNPEAPFPTARYLGWDSPWVHHVFDALGFEGLEELVRFGADPLELDRDGCSLLFDTDAMTPEVLTTLVTEWGLDLMRPSLDSEVAMELYLDRPDIIEAALGLGLDPFIPLPSGHTLHETLLAEMDSDVGRIPEYQPGYAAVARLFEALFERQHLSRTLGAPAPALTLPKGATRL